MCRKTNTNNEMYLSDKNKSYTMFAKKEKGCYPFRNGTAEISIFILKKKNVKIKPCKVLVQYIYYLFFVFTKTNACPLKRIGNIINGI